ncbi:MAG: phosphorylase [Acidobacteria bacterium]|nr:phosphorylase [Acidobacteriota bacterium]
MQPTTAIIAALPREVAALIRGTPPDPALLRSGVHLHRLPSAIVVTAGMGAARAAIAVQAALAAGSITTLISAGLAGSCTPALTPGSAAEATLVIDARTGERFTTASPNPAATITLATAAAIASIQEKSRLAATYNASLVDMEAATVARLAAAHNVAFRAIKAVSDAHDFELASLSEFEGKHGTFRTAAFALHTALRPADWRKTIHLGRNSARALAALDQALRAAVNPSVPAGDPPHVSHSQ